MMKHENEAERTSRVFSAIPDSHFKTIAQKKVKLKVDMYAYALERINTTINHDFGGDIGVHKIAVGESNWHWWSTEVKVFADMLVLDGRADERFLIKTEDSMIHVTAKEFYGMLLAAAEFRQSIWIPYMRLEYKPPADFKDEKYWVKGVKADAIS